MALKNVKASEATFTLKRQRKRICVFTENLMGTYKSVLNNRCLGNLHASETIITVKYQGLVNAPKIM